MASGSLVASLRLVTGSLVRCTVVVCGCNALLTGYHMVVLNSPRKVISAHLNASYCARGHCLSPAAYLALESTGNTLYLLLAALGSLLAGYLNDKHGRYVLLVSRHFEK